MAVFFNDFPIIDYDINGKGDTVQATDIFRRFRPIQELMNNITIYYTYDVMDGERPDIVSYKFYKTVDYDWIILMFNKMRDRYFDWPMSYREFTDFIKKKYGSIQNAMQTVHEYRMILQPHQVLNDGTVVQERSLIVDETTYYSLPAHERKIVYAYDYYNELNEKRRTIKIPNEIYLGQILQEKETILNG